MQQFELNELLTYRCSAAVVDARKLLRLGVES